MPGILVFRRLRQKDHGFESSVAEIASSKDTQLYCKTLVS